MKLQTELTPSEVGNLLRYTINQNVELANNGHLPIAYNIEGLPGISKTSTVKQICDETKTHHYIRLNVAEMDPGD
jgi:hypothetical protein